MVWRVEFSEQALATLQRMPRNVKATILAKLDRLAADPSAPNNNVRVLQGEPGFRLRVGDWRVIYRLDQGRLVVVVIRIAPRGDAYR
jgi:mRNA interferase RelE/StbE